MLKTLILMPIALRKSHVIYYAIGVTLEVVGVPKSYSTFVVSSTSNLVFLVKTYLNTILKSSIVGISHDFTVKYLKYFSDQSV